ncbi:DUF1080 domain-containing protein [Sphingomonas sp. GC_Shp_3]|uniref:3-keto-disaccharide hydrolase n=1 Tax=Sphingomonas sp. GC_Shp_3 TaxID=2937383 RepID=UPI002269E025|nr:DUF1080 domain-containing protein [Sphingomonas sp. GC_Shp_3]
MWPDCIEYQIMERNTGDALPINHRAVGGISLGGLPSWPDNPPGYHVYGPQFDAGGSLRQNLKADGDFASLTDWNTVELIATGQKAAHIVNGRIVNTLFDMEARSNGKYVPLTRGRILLQIECSEILFRNVRIRPL